MFFHVIYIFHLEISLFRKKAEELALGMDFEVKQLKENPQKIMDHNPTDN